MRVEVLPPASSFFSSASFSYAPSSLVSPFYIPPLSLSLSSSLPPQPSLFTTLILLSTSSTPLHFHDCPLPPSSTLSYSQSRGVEDGRRVAGERERGCRGGEAIRTRMEEGEDKVEGKRGWKEDKKGGREERSREVM